MVWSKWKGAALAVLALASLTSASLVYSQQAASQPQTGGTKTGDVVTVQEAGKPAQKFVIQKSYRAANGQIVYEMRNVKTGEVSTFYNDDKTPASPKSKAAGTAPADAKGNSAIKLVSATSTSPAPSTAQVQTVMAPSGGATMAPSGTVTSSDAKSKPTLVQWIKSLRGGSQSDDVVQQAPTTPSPSKVSTSNNSKPTLVQWLRGGSSGGGQPDPFSQDRVVSAPMDNSGGKIYPMAASSPPMANSSPYAPTPTPTVAAQFRTIEESGQAPLKCRVVTTWRTSDGKKASQLQALDSGEFLTIVETGPVGDGEGEGGKTTATLYHWGHNKTAPSGVPLPPLSAYAANKPAQPVKTSTTAAAKMPRLTEVPAASTGVTPMELPDAPVAAKSTRPIDTVKPASKAVDAFKAYDTAKTTETPKAAETSKATELPKAPEPIKVVDAPKPTPKPAEAAKAPTMPSPPAEFPKQIAPVSPAPINVGKPATDTTPSTTNSLPSMPLSLSTPPSTPNASAAVPMPPMPAQLALGNALPPALPSIAPTNSMLGSQFVGSTKSDPLSSPESFAPLSDQKALAKTPAKAPVGGSAQATDYPRVPLGAASVAAAANAGDACVQPAQGTSAFPANPQMAAGSMNPGTPDQTTFANAFSTPPSVMQQQAAGMAFQQTGPMMPMMAGGYPMPPASPAMMGYGYGPPPMGLPPAMPMQGRMPIAMTPGLAMQAPMPQYQMPIATPAPTSMAYANPAMDRPGMPANGSLSVMQCMGVLQSSLYPSQRETAVIQLCSCDWRNNPHVVTMLLTTAKEDPAAMVRVAAINALVRMGVATDSVVATFNQLKSDVDGRVRLEAEEALKVVSTR